VTRSGSLKRLALFGVVVLVSFVALYVPTLTGEAPWSWFIGAAPGWVWFVAGLGVGLLVSHFTWPQTARWPELERLCANLVIEWRGGALPFEGDMEQMEALVRPHVLERERR